MNVKGKFRGMTLLTELKKRGSISKIDFEKVSWYLENLDEVDYHLGKKSIEFKQLKENLESLENANKVLEDNNLSLRKENQNLKEGNQKLMKGLSEFEERNHVLSDNIQICSQQLEALTTNRNFWIAIAFLSAVVSIGLIVKEFFV